MSIPQVPVSRKLEYVIYLGFSVILMTYLSTLIPLSMWTDADIEKPLFVAISSSALAAGLFSVRFDRIVDRFWEWRIRKTKKLESIGQFLARVSIFLRVWEITPTPIAPIEDQSQRAVRATLEGEDLHEDMWTQKGLLFLILSLIPAWLLIPLPMFVLSLHVFMLTIPTRFVLVISSCIIVLAVWMHRYKQFHERCITALKFRYYQDVLHTERLMRTAQVPTKETAGVPSWMDSRPIHWNMRELDEYKESLVKQTQEMDKVLCRREWWRFTAQFRSIEEMLDASTKRFLEQQALDFCILAWSELLAPPNDTNPDEVAARFESLKLALRPLIRAHAQLGLFCKITNKQVSNLGNFLEIIDPQTVNPSIHKSIGRALGRSLEDGIEDKDIAKIGTWLQGPVPSILGAVNIFHSMDPLACEDILRSIAVRMDKAVSAAVLEAAKGVSQYEVPYILATLQFLPKDDETLKRTVEFLVVSSTSDNSTVREMAIDSLGNICDDILRFTSAHEALENALGRGGDRLRLSAAFALRRLGDKLKEHQSMIAVIKKQIPCRDQYLQGVLLDALRISGAWTLPYHDLLVELALDRCQTKVRSLPVPQALRALRSSEVSEVISAIRVLRNNSSWTSDKQMIVSMVEAFKDTPHDCLRLAIAGTLAEQGKSVPYDSEIVEAMFRAAEAVGKPEYGCILGYTLGSFSGEYIFGITERLDNSSMGHLAALAVHHTDAFPSSHDIINRLTRFMDTSNSEFQIACLLAVKSLGERVRPYQSLIDKIGRFLEYQQETALACALDCLGSIGGLRVLRILETAKLRLDRWWLRDLYRDAIKRCRESLAAHSL